MSDTLDILLQDARCACLPLSPADRFDAWLRIWRPAAMTIVRQGRTLQGKVLTDWLKVADMVLDACRIEPVEE